MNTLIRANPLITLPIGTVLLALSSMFIDALSIPLLFFLQLIAFICVWQGVTQLFERFPFRLNRKNEQHMDWMALVQYATICIGLGVMLLQDPMRFEWFVNGSRFYFTLIVAHVAYYVVRLVGQPLYLNQPPAPDILLHHISYMVLFATALLLGHWEYIFKWVVFLNLLYAIPSKILLIHTASAHPNTYWWYLIQYGVWLVLRVGVYSALTIGYFFGIDKSALPVSFFWTFVVPFTFLLTMALAVYWTINMTGRVSKIWRRRNFRRVRARATVRG